MSGTVKSWWRLTKVVPIAALNQWNRWSTSTTVVPSLNTGDDTMPTSFGKKENLSPQKSFSNLFDLPLCETVKRFSRIWFFLGSGLLWIVWQQQNDSFFKTIFNGALRKHIKSFGMPSMIMGGLNGNGCSGPWKKPPTWPTMTFLTILI